jgi:Ala-tRNA(Pro) deacylase
LVARNTQFSPEQLLAYLDELGIGHQTVDHPPVFTVDEAKLLRGSLPGGNCKSLFLRNKKGRMWLVVVQEDHRVDLARLGASLGAGRLSFASPERLMEHLAVIPGAVTPLAVVNDHAGMVEVAVAKALLAEERLNFHPLVNDRTTTIASSDLVKFLEATDHPPRVLRTDDV